MTINIALDGPSGAGKSTLAKRLAKELNFVYVDTGALYRTVALFMLRRQIRADDKEGVLSQLTNVHVRFGYVDGEQHVFLNGEDVSGLIRTQEVSMAASTVSAIPEVRAFLLSLQQDIAASENVIMDGRDIGTVVLPHAQIKIFLTASPEKRAERRFLELKEKGLEQDGAYERILEEIRQRDHNDSTRSTAPLKQADDAVLFDNSDFCFEESVDVALKIIREKM